MRWFVAILAVCAMSCGCNRTVDLTAGHLGPAPRCEVHGTEMKPEIIEVSSGEMIYVQTEYSEPLKRDFPHHGGVILSSEREFRSDFVETHIRDFVCPDCTRAYHQWWEDRRRSM
jgi:hypothetical protein